MNDTTVHAQARRWMDEDPDAETRAEVQALLDAGDDAGLEDRFGSALTFGTAGLRGVVGAGPNRMNRVVVLRTSAGLARYLKRTVPGAAERGVVVGCDARRGSPEFKADVARALAAEGVRALVFERPVPTPVVAFTVRETGAAAGVVITASHNPPEYNGYKVYAAHGGQIVPPDDEGIAAEIAAVGDVRPLIDAPARAAVETLGEAAEQAYRSMVRGVGTPGVPLKIAYTALHGVGARFATKALAPYGSVYSVAAQAEPDGSFPTVRFPNPEEPGAMDLVLSIAAAEGADLALANDPDADRLAVAVPTPMGWRMLTGNEVGVLLGDHLLRTTSGDRFVANSVVSSPMLGVIAASYGSRCLETLTGFKWIAYTAERETERTGARWIFGYEEALGYAVTTAVRDKDGITAAVCMASLAAALKAEGSTLYARLEALYARHGRYVSVQHNVTAPGATGAARIATIMAAFRAKPLTSLAGVAVVRTLDYAVGADGLPPSDVLRYDLAGGGRVMLRPSGTEPKIKYYFDHPEPAQPHDDTASHEMRARARLSELRQAFIAEVTARVG